MDGPIDCIRNRTNLPLLCALLIVMRTHLVTAGCVFAVPVQSVVGLVDGQVTLPCEASRPDPADKLELVLWYRLGSKSPFYT